MNRSRISLACVAVVAGAASLAIAQQPPKDAKPATKDAQPAKPGEHQLPPGMSEADMQACMAAATPGPMHEHLAKGVGTWIGKVTSYCMSPEPTRSECTTVITGIMDGRFFKSETSGEMPGMGPFNGFAIVGYDNVAKKFQQTWIDNMGTGMMISTGELSPDGKTLTWTGTYTCPIKKGPVTYRMIENYTGKDTMTFTMYGPNPMDGKETKMMEISYTRKGATAGAEKPAAPKAPTAQGH
jgi:hypothetical protein